MILRPFIFRIREKIVRVEEVLSSYDTPGYVLNVNLFALSLAINRPDFREAFYGSRLVHVDGKGAGLILWFLLGDTFKPSGYRQWASKIFEKNKSKKIFLLGGTELENTLAITNLLSTHSHLSVEGINGYVTNSAIIDKLKRTDPDIIFVGMGMPKQELLINELSAYFPLKTFYACGGWIKQIAGLENDCPTIISRIGLEWLFRSVIRSGHLMNRVIKPAVNVARDLFR